MATFWVISKRLRARLSTRSMCLDADTQELISEFAMRISLSSMSILSHEIGNESGDDYVISQCFPGGHEGFMETLIRIKLRSSRVLQVKEANDLMSDTYDHLIHDRNNLKLVADIVARYSFKGEILNLGYGAGNIGTLILAVHDANLTGVDISPKTMIHAKHYKKATDIDQIEGAFIQGIGWSTTEESLYFPNGHQFTQGPGNRKFPAFQSIPQESIIFFFEDVTHDSVKTTFKSKGVGEPPLFLGSSVYSAILNALWYARQENGHPV
ncbi:xylitol dehydrogenase [Lunasporangiospora selenospora]|uniref:Xylitol dehydrogenase n=1 Tax=Lunasporangiospora selenospora TaxID=979761 RepID=A0A9P6FKV7_9FUNG|nr:xylitol dehydrogenase [Lunasporangiospora selenospora]